MYPYIALLRRTSSIEKVLVMVVFASFQVLKRWL
jgi:hypothetical protein